MPAIARSLLVLVLVALALPGCGGGGGGSGKNNNNGGAGNPFGNNFAVLAGPSGGVIPGLNSELTLTFNKKIDATSVNGGVITIVTIADPSGAAEAPAGTVASFNLEVDGKRLIVKPTVEFGTENVFFGFVENALFEIAFADPATGNSIRSVVGDTMVNSGQTYLFRTGEKAVDSNPGFPQVRAWLVPDPDAAVLPGTIADDDSDGSLFDDAIALFAGAEELIGPGPQALPASPVSEILFIFDDALLPETVINPVDSTSPAVRVLINTLPVPAFQPIIAPANLSFLHQQADLTIVRWASDFAALPPSAFLIAEVTASVQDLGCNSKASLTGDSSPSLSVALSVAGGVDGTVYEVVEPFDDDAKNDVARTSASWASPVGELAPVLGGGRGLDGPFVIDPDGSVDAPGETRVPLLAVIDWDAQTVALPTVVEAAGVREPRTWEFTRLVLPNDWTLAPLFDRDGDETVDEEEFIVSSAGHPLDGLGAPLLIKCTEGIDISGTVLLDGVDAEDMVVDTGNDGAYFGQGAPGAESLLAGGAGGRGGDSLLAEDTDDDGEVDTVLLSLTSPAVEDPGLEFEENIPKRKGVTGRSEAVTASTLVDNDLNLNLINTNPTLAAMLAAGELMLQPNAGIGSSFEGNAGTANQFIDENHKTFVITDVSVSAAITTITVDVSDGSSLIMASQNIGTGYSPISAAGDAYIIGRFRGADGGDLAGWQRGGVGAQPYLVVNEGALGVTTASGGGGGGGGIQAGGDGGSSGAESDPTVNQRGIGNGDTTGISQDESAGAAGGFGAPRGTVMVVDDVTLDLVSSSSGLSPVDIGGAALVGAQIVVDAASNGWAFRVASFDGLSFVVERIQSGDVDIGLTDGDGGVEGPGLTTTEVVDFLLVPPEGLGGAGGGGAGASVTGTVNTSPDVLPTITPGAAGGSSAGATVLETAGTFTLRNSGSVSAQGGMGGALIDATRIFAGGGGAAGGAISVRAGQGITIFQGGVLTVAGGAGGGLDGHGLGGDGGGGWLRLETFADDLNPVTFANSTVPAVKEENLGRFVGDPQGVAQSRFYHTGLANPQPTELQIDYRADTDGDDALEDLSWMFTNTGADGGPEGYTRPPFTFTFNARGVDENGFQDASEPNVFYKAHDLLSGRSGYVYDPVNDVRLFAIGENADQLHVLTDTCLGTGCDTLPFDEIPAVDDSQLDISSLAFGGLEDELFLLERARGRVHVLDRTTGAFLRTITLPAVVEGGMAVLSDGVDAANDRLLIAANREEVLITVALRDDAAAEPATTDLTVTGFESQVSLSYDGVALDDIEITGLAYDAATETLWVVDAPTGFVTQLDWSAGNEGVGLAGVHARGRLTAAGEGVLLSSLAYDGALLWFVRAVEGDTTTTFALDPATLPTDGSDVALANFGATLPEVAPSIADSKVFVRFRVTLDATFVDELHGGGPVPFEGMVIDEITFRLENAAF